MLDDLARMHSKRSARIAAKAGKRVDEIRAGMPRAALEGLGLPTVDVRKIIQARMSSLPKSAGTEELTEAFLVFDKNRDGVIDSSELMAVMKNAGEEVTDEEIAEMVRKSDTKGCGTVDFEDFVRMMMTR